MLIVDGQIHLWEKGAPSPPHRQEPYSGEQAIAAMDQAGPSAPTCNGRPLAASADLAECSDGPKRLAPHNLSPTRRWRQRIWLANCWPNLRARPPAANGLPEFSCAYTVPLLPIKSDGRLSI